jgi:leucine-rich repeat-containing G protein-coupled receptor 7/leucine-rich repeat-containing G protein-coupled receptor 8
MWVIGTSAFFGNIAVIFQRIMHQRSTLNTPYGLFIMNLSISDMIMGIYVYIISIADVIFRGKYILHDKYWRDSFICKVSGVLSTLSSEMSVNFIMIISFQRFIVTKLPMTHTVGA